MCRHSFNSPQFKGHLPFAILSHRCIRLSASSTHPARLLVPFYLEAATNIVDYLRDIATQPDWREHKLVQALGNPGPGGLDLFGEVIEPLRQRNKFGEKWAGDMLQHIYEVMVREQNPILEAENHPFCKYLRYRDGVETGSDSGSDSEYLTSSIESDEE